MTKLIWHLTSVCCALLAASAGFAGEQPEEEPKLALVLSGGGARGVAHVGVLRVLEELQIAPDLVVGTSMGSIVGGLYAAGWSPDEIEALVKEVDWETIFTDRLDRRSRSFRRKLDDYPLMIQGRLHFSGTKLILPSGVIDGQRLELLLRVLEAQSPATDDFDDLPIPFRAVAAEISTGEAVVLDGGSLATALRASMSIPGALPPVTIDGRELVDGGIAANLPVGVAKELGATRIIAVDISSPLATDEQEFDSFMGVYNHLNSLLTVANRDRDAALLGPRDLLIVPDLGDISFISFDRAEEAAAIGEQAARLVIDELRTFTGTEQRWASFARRPRADTSNPIEVARLRLDNTSLVDDRLVRQALNIDPPQSIDRDLLGLDMLELYNTRFFGTIEFKIEELEDTSHELIVHTPPPQYGRGSLQFGLGFLDDFDGNSTYHIVVRHQFLPANRRGAEWETLVQLGTVSGASTSYYQPLDWARRWFVEPSLRYERGTQEIWFLEYALAEYQFRIFDARLSVGRVLGRWGEMRLSAFAGQHRGAPRLGDPAFRTVSDDRGGAEVSFRVDTEDSVAFPQRGASVSLIYTDSSQSLGADFEIRQFQGVASNAWTFGKTTFVPYVEYADNLDPAETFFQARFLGGLFRLSGLATDELFGDSSALARLLVYRRLMSFDVAGARVRIFAGLSLEAGNVYFDDAGISWGSMRKGGSIFIGGDTFIGPVIFAYGRTEGNRDRFYLAIGDTF